MAIGVTAKVEVELGSTYTEIPSVRKFTFPDVAVTSIDTTSINITDYCKTYSAGMVDNGMITFDCEFSEDTYNDLDGILRTTVGWRVTGPTEEAIILDFDGFVTKLSVSGEPDVDMLITCEVKVTGAVTIT